MQLFYNACTVLSPFYILTFGLLGSVVLDLFKSDCWEECAVEEGTVLLLLCWFSLSEEIEGFVTLNRAYLELIAADY